VIVQKIIIKLLTKQFKLDKLVKYVFEPNELDIGFQELKKENIEMKADIQLLKQLYTKEK
jgi:hypothetical protein|tara:strand:- start:1332 stop:1511 length:180 start_codon:yes stop_codon:yes gene_type:complete